MKRILILTADAGLGHRSAAEAIAEAMQERYNSNCDVQVINPLDDERVPAVLRESQDDYDRMVNETPDLYRIGYQISDADLPGLVIEGALTALLYGVMRDMVRELAPDVIVTTYPIYQAPLGAVKQDEGIDSPLITVVTDLVTVHRIWFSPAADLYVVPTEAARETALGYGLPEESVEIIGIPVDPEISRERRDRAAVRAELGWKQGVTTFLVVGGKRVNHLDNTLRALNHSGLPLQMVIVSGKDEDTYRAYREEDWHLETRVYGFVDNIPAMMRAASAILCKAGGLIVSEALAAGLPLLLADVLPGQEEGNASYVIEGGAGEQVIDPVGALETVYHWLAQEGALLAERARHARRLGCPRAAYTIAEQVWASA